MGDKYKIQRGSGRQVRVMEEMQAQRRKTVVGHSVKSHGRTSGKPHLHVRYHTQCISRMLPADDIDRGSEVVQGQMGGVELVFILLAIALPEWVSGCV